MAETIRFSTDWFPAPERFDAWREIASASFGMALDPPFRNRLAYHATAELHQRGGTALARLEGDGAVSRRGRREISQRAMDGYVIYRERGEGIHVDIAGRTIEARRGTLLIGDPNEPFVMRPVTRFRQDALLLPKALLDPHMPAQRRPVGHILSGQSGTGALAATYCDEMVRQWGNLSDAEADASIAILCRLIGIALGTAAGAEPDAVRAGRCAEVRRHIDLNLADPTLSPVTAAAALRLSVRVLREALEPSGTSFAALVRRRRLEECRASLLADPTRAVTDVAFAWGFNSLASFYRGFQAAFGLSPGDLREAAATGRLGPPAENEVRSRVL